MSYDVSIGDAWFNYTSNVAALFYDHIPPRDEGCCGGLHALNGLTGKQAVTILQDAFRAIHQGYCDDPRFGTKYDAPNGWGSTVGGLIFLAQIFAACAANPRKKVKVDA